MPLSIFLRRATLLWMLLLVAGTALAQKPVQVNVSLIPPYSTRIADFYLGNSPKLNVVLVNHDLTKAALQVRLKMTVKNGSGAILVQSSEYGNYPAIYLDAGVPASVNMGDLTPYFNANNLNFMGLSRQEYQQGFLKEGIVSFCFEVVEVASRQSVSNEACAQAMLSFYEPPLLNMPARASSIQQREPTNIVFTWTPRHMGSLEGAFNTEYLFQLAEINDKAVNPQSAFESGKPLYEQTTTATALVYGPAEPLLLPGRRYAWRVQIKQRSNPGDGQQARNNGFSEVFYFDYVGQVQQTADKGAPVYRSHDPRPSRVWLDGYWKRAMFLASVKPPATAPGQVPVEYLVETKGLDNNGTGYSTPVQSTPVVGGIAPPHAWILVDRAAQWFKDADPWRFMLRVGAKYADGSVAWDVWHSSEATNASTEPRIKGSFVWAFSKEEETQDNSGGSLLKQITKNEESFRTVPYTPGATRYPANGFNVSLYETTYGHHSLIATEKVTDGKFNFKSPARYGYGTARKFSIVVEYNPSYLGSQDKTASFRSKQAEFAFTYGESDTTLPVIVLQPKTTTLSAGVVCADCTDPTQIAVDLLIKESDLEAMPRMKLAGFGLDAERVTLNSNTYRIITTLRDGNAFKKILNPSGPNVHYWMRVRYKNADPKFYPLPPLYTEKEETRMLTQWVSFSPMADRKISGRITLKDKPRRDARVTLSIPGSSIIPADSRATVEFTAISDADGNYTFTKLPDVRKGAPFRITVVDAGIRPTPFSYELSGDESNKRTFDIRLSNPVLTLVGRIVDENGDGQYAELEVDGRKIATTPGSMGAGYYLVQVWDEAPKTIKVVAQGYREEVITYTPRRFVNGGGNMQYTVDDWARVISKLDIVKDISKNYSGLISPQYFHFSAHSWQMLYDRELRSVDEVKGAAGIPVVVIKKRSSRLTVNLPTLPAGTTGKIRFSNNRAKEIGFRSGTLFEAPIGWHNYTITIDGSDEFMKIEGGVSISEWANNTLDVRPVPATRLSGKVRGIPGGAAEKGVRVAVSGFSYETSSDGDGNYSLLLPRNEEFSFEIYKDGFEQIDSTFRFTAKTATLNFFLSKRDPSLPVIKTLAGFPVTVASMRAGGKDVYEISGTLTLKDNKIFSIKPGGETTNVLKYKKVRVTVDEKDRSAAIPATEITFEEPVLNMQAWGWAPVELGGSKGIRLRAGLKNGQEDWTKGNIGAETLTLLLRTQQRVAGLPIQLPDADLILDNAQSLVLDSTKKFRFAFSASESGIAALHEDAQFRLKFLTADTARVLDKRGLTKDTARQDARYLEAPLALVTSLTIARDTAMLNKDGINMAGYMKFPEIRGMKGDSSKVRINKFIIGKDFSVKEFNFNVGERNPIIVGVQKLQARLTSIAVKDLGTPNLSFGFGGAILLKRADTAANKAAAAPKLGGAATAGKTNPVADTAKAQYDEALIIKEFSLTRTPEGNTVTAELKLGAKGIGVKGLTFTTPGESSIKMAYNNAEKSFEFDGSGLISYQKQNAGKAGQQASKGNDSAASSMFPIEIQKFQLRSKDWSMYLAAKANVKINMKVATLNVEKIVVNVGSKVTMQEMNNFLTGDSTKTGNLTQDLAPDEPLDEKTASWAIGVKGGFTFGIKSLETKAAGSFLLGNVADKFQIQVNEIELGIKNAAFELAAKVSMAFNDSCAGFQAEAKLTAMKKELEAKFGFYKLYATNSGQKEGIRLFAAVKASVAIVTGPIMWHKIGGGFDFNTSSNEYKVRLDGDLGPAGTPKETMVVQNAFVEILFQTDKCGGYPVINGGGELAMNSKVMAEAKIVLDFCTPMVLVEIKTPNPVPIPMVPGMLGKFEGVFYATAKKVNNELVPTIFLYAGVDLSSMGELLKGNLYFAFGYNYDNNAKDVPAECQSRFAKITDYAKTRSELHAVAIAGSLSINTSNDFDIKLGGLKLGYAKYYFDAGGDVLVAVKLRDGATRAAVGVHVKFGAEVQLLSLNVRGDVALALGLEGGYADLREEGIRDKYAALKEKGIDNFSIDHHIIPELTADRRYKVARLDANASLRVLNPGMQYTDLYGEQWPKLYEPKFSELNGVTVNAANSRMYTEASAGQKFSFLLKRSDISSTSGYQLRVRYPVGKGPGSQGEKLFVNGTQLSKSARWHNIDANFDDFYYDIPASALNRRDEVRVSFQASATQKMQRIYRTSLFYKGTEDDWYMPHPNEQRPYWDMLENMQRDAKSPDRNLRSHYVSKRALDDADWETYRTKYEVERPTLNGNTVGRWVLEDNRTYATAYAGGSYSFKLKNTTDDTSLVLRVRYWGSDKNKAQTIFINDMMLTRSTVNEDFPGQSFDVDYIIPGKFLTSKDLVIKYLADANTSSPTVIKTILKYDDSYYEKKMLEELSQLKDGAGTKSWYLKGYASFTASLAMNNYPHCNDYCIFCSPRGFKLCLGVSGKFYWRKPDGQSATLQREFSFGSKTQ